MLTENSLEPARATQLENDADQPVIQTVQFNVTTPILHFNDVLIESSKIYAQQNGLTFIRLADNIQFVSTLITCLTSVTCKQSSLKWYWKTRLEINFLISIQNRQ
ncbi:hypothetical protein [Virgibacillus sp. Bac330]|uniref:hypothetical protein n=1 Tax=Virgibacillus sp. Bac330 TaxID=2419841 RepID=UPI000EF4A4E8|nr:hypothetical protein [Virgibacillus sp. Bac330]